ncbi:hypothetical protein [Zwartia sp.]|uniref:hypothetical protein n=1 Tax=Zwartia sp. TaxID=2978004 RepID=UPI00271D6064|nr:hypothetical protein [Zwartia sp.]MDO9023441.1 hypothetical protein [Zwartia sp.]
MKLPIQTEPALWGAVAGAIVATALGFGFADWHTSGKVESLSAARGSAATVTALVPVCTEMFKRDSNFDANLAALKKTDEWARYTFIEKGGWGQMPGTEKLNNETASQCAKSLLKT